MYTSNPHMPKIRMEAVRLVRSHLWSTRKVARHFGFTQSAIVKWCKKAPKDGRKTIPTESSRPHHHPKQLNKDTIEQIVTIREATGRTSEVVHEMLHARGVTVSLNSVRRTIDRVGLMKKRSPWKRYHPHVDRPRAEKPGDLVQLDTIHRMIDEKRRLYIFVAIDVCSRWVFAKAYAKMNGATTIRFVREAERRAPFSFAMLQSDHGPEFSSWFVEQMKKSHRYTRIGKPNDNAHIERFNRTIQEEYLDKLPDDVRQINGGIKKYLQYYNHERLHMGISLKTPMYIIQNRFQAIG